MSDVTRAARTLLTSLGEYKAIEMPGAQVGQMFNTILQAAKTEHPDDLIISSLRPVGVGRSRINAQAGEIRSMLQQILTVYGDDGPSVG